MNHKNSPHTAINDDLEPQLEAAVWAVLAEPISASAIERVKSQAIALEDKARPSVAAGALARSWNRRWFQMAALAAGLLLVIGATSLLPSSSNAFAQAIERLKSVGDFRYKELVYISTQEKPVEVEVLIAEDGRERRSILGVVSVHDPSGQIRLSLIEANKSATVHQPMVERPDDSQQKLKWLEKLKSYGTKPDKQLGKMAIDGRECQGFEVKLAEALYSIWVDTKTNDLVQVEFKGMPKGSPVTKSVMKDFEFNVKLDASLFSFDVPQGYTALTAAKLPELIPFEESLVEALQGFTEVSGGKFPKSISDWGEWSILLSDRSIAREKATKISVRLGTLLPTLTGLSQDDYDYSGAGKKVGDKRTIVFWYRNPEKQVRALFSDFTFATISEDELKSR